MERIKEIDVAELDQYIKNGAELVDVREAQELEDEGVIPGYKHMPLSSFDDYEGQVSKSKPTVFYCRSGRRSLKAAELALGWTTQPLYSLRGGILAYHAKNSG